MSAWIPFVALCAILWIAALAVIVVTNAKERADLQRLALLDQQAADWGEPTRAQVEWELHVAEVLALSEMPIHDALARDLFIADALDEIDELTSGGRTA